MKPLSRRAVLRGIGGTAIALPWLDAMAEQAMPLPRPAAPHHVRVLANGTLFDRFVPTTDAPGNITAMSKHAGAARAVQSQS